MPVGIALVDRDGRLLFLNSVFGRAANVPEGDKPAYPGDLVVAEDQAALAAAVRRYAVGPQMSGDIAVRLRNQPEEPVAFSLSGVRGLGEAAVVLTLKDDNEEGRLKRQVAQATKMQAVGQLAGGVLRRARYREGYDRRCDRFGLSQQVHVRRHRAFRAAA